MAGRLRPRSAVTFLFFILTTQFSSTSALLVPPACTSPVSELSDTTGASTTEVVLLRATPSTEDFLQAGMVSEQSGQIDINIGSNWPMFKNQTSRLGFNPFERTISKDNARFLGLSWVGLLGYLVDFSSPAVVNGIVYIASTDGNLYVFNANGCGQSSCNPLWVGAMNSNYSSVSSPAIANGMVYVGSDHKLYVFAAAGCGQSTCSPLWTANTGGAVFSSPLVTSNTVYVGSEDHRLYAFAANGCGRSTCTALWIGNTGGAIDSSPALGNGVIYLGSQDGKLYA